MIWRTSFRLLQCIIVVLVVSIGAFVIGNLIGDPVVSLLGLDADATEQAALRTQLHLNQPFFIQYYFYIKNVLAGDFGTSYVTQAPVINEFVQRAPATVELAICALFISFLIGVPLGVIAAVYKDNRSAKIILFLTVLGISIPTFFISIILISIFSLYLGWFPAFGRGQVVKISFWTTGFLSRTGLQSLVLPALSLSLGQIALVARLTRGDMLSVLSTDYIKFARARGLSLYQIYIVHALRSTLISLVTVGGIQVGYLVAFSVVVEQVFQWPGTGLLFLDSLSEGDVPVIRAYLILCSVLFIAINFLVDVICSFIDPRIRTR